MIASPKMEHFKPDSNRPSLLDKPEHTLALLPPAKGGAGEVRLDNVLDITMC